MTIVARSQGLAAAPAADPSTGEYGVLYSDVSLVVFPNLVTDASRTEDQARAAAAAVSSMCLGLRWALMYRADRTDRWREVGTGRSARQVLADSWHIRLDAGGW